MKSILPAILAAMMLTAAPKFTEVTFKTTIDCKNCVMQVLSE